MEGSKNPKKTLGSKIMLWLGRSAHMNSMHISLLNGKEFEWDTYIFKCLKKKTMKDHMSDE